MEASLSYPLAVLPRNGCLDSVLGEASRGQEPRSLRAPTSTRDDPLRTPPLRHESSQDGVDRVDGDATPLEIVSDHRVAAAALGESRGPKGREAPVVDIAET